MKIKINKEKLLKCLINISKAIDPYSPLYQLKGVYILATQSFLKLIASNGIFSIQKIIELDSQITVIEPGEILIPGRLFQEIIKTQKEDIEIKLINDSIIISSKGTIAYLNTLNVNDYPIIDFSKSGKELIVDVDKIRDVISNVYFAAAKDDSRIIFNGINLKASKGILTATATDSFRVAHEKKSIDSNIDFDITIFSKNLKDFIPSDVKDKINISINDSKIITQSKNTTIVSKLMDGVYPDIEKIIPTKFLNTLIIERKELENLIEKVIVVSNDNLKIVRMVVDQKNLLIESKKNEIGNIQANSSNFQWDGTKFSIVFNALFLKEAISKFSGLIELKINGDVKPIIITGSSSPMLTQLVLPNRIY